MATPILLQVSKDLAYKLQDPVSSGTTNGQRITAAERLNYILRGYRRLLRIVTMLYPDLINKMFQSYYRIATATTSATGTLTTSTVDFTEIFEVFAKEPSDEDYTKCNWITADNFEQVDSGQNAFYSPNLNTKSYYWTIINNVLTISPSTQYNVKLTYRPNMVKEVEDSGYNGDYDLDVPTEHTDLLLSLSAAEAYLDIGQGDMVNAYKSDVTEQLRILVNVDKKRETEDTTNEV